MATLNDILFGGSAEWNRNALVNVLNQLNSTRQVGMDGMMGAKDDLYSRLIPFLDNAGAGNEKTRQNVTGLLNDSLNPDSAYNAFNFFGNDPFERGSNPQQAGLMGQQAGLAGNQAGMGDLANQVFQGGGWTQQGQNLFDNLDKFRAGGGPNDQMRNLAMQVIQGGGANPYSNFTVDKGTEAINRGGATQQSDSLMNFGQQGLQERGMTPWDQMALGAAQQGLQTQGFNPNSNALSGTGQGLLSSGGRNLENEFLKGRGKQILETNPLLSMDEVTSGAADRAGSLFAQNSQQNYEQAMKRGGGPGTLSGLQNQAVQENEDSMLRGISEAVNSARMGQQGLQLQQFQNGAGLMGSGMEDVLRNLQTGGNLTSQGEQSALARMLGLTSLGSDSSNRALNAQQLYSQMLGQSGQLSNQNMQTLGGLGMQGLGEANDKLNSGINMFGQTQGNDLQALQQYLQTLGQTNNYALGAGGLANQSFGGAQQGLSGIFGQNMQQGQFGLDRQKTQFGAQQGNMNSGMNFLNQQQGNFLQGLNPIQNTQNLGAQQFLGGSTSQAGLFSPNTNVQGGILSDLISGGASVASKMAGS
ncbi:hypothetical protein UFOVP434_37 [uncultured Caudovirales phage]|uniref:Uncharacterized protein n=1 Tax=uncultured Caudovirales phage TaxID=2100421 RepID=A0A6J5M7V5_9CAUD|nr:hypothetical protein UFOVP434_37 [uncultured Caudovirales phage]